MPNLAAEKQKEVNIVDEPPEIIPELINNYFKNLSLYMLNKNMEQCKISDDGTMESTIKLSPVLSHIYNASKLWKIERVPRDEYPVLGNYLIGIDNKRRFRFISAEIRFEDLDRGIEWTESAFECAVFIGITPGDKTFQLIDFTLGGSCYGSINTYPINQEVTTASWKLNEKNIYNHVKLGDDRTAHAMFALEFDHDQGRLMFRPSLIYFHYTLYHKNNIVADPIEGILKNPIPIVF